MTLLGLELRNPWLRLSRGILLVELLLALICDRAFVVMVLRSRAEESPIRNCAGVLVGPQRCLEQHSIDGRDEGS